MTTTQLAVAGAAGLALYAGHHVGDYWIQTHQESQHKGDAGLDGALTCFTHVATYLATQAMCLGLLSLATGAPRSGWAFGVALLVSGVTHYAADRREHGLMFWLVRRMPWKVGFLTLGVPRPHEIYAIRPEGMEKVKVDNPSLGTGAWALDQSWHIFWGVFVPALILAAWS